jgi:hypothetical protein
MQPLQNPPLCSSTSSDTKNCGAGDICALEELFNNFQQKCSGCDGKGGGGGGTHIERRWPHYLSKMNGSQQRGDTFNSSLNTWGGEVINSFSTRYIMS